MRPKVYLAPGRHILLNPQTSKIMAGDHVFHEIGDTGTILVHAQTNSTGVWFHTQVMLVADTRGRFWLVEHP